jgi:hypothetical protein
MGVCRVWRRALCEAVRESGAAEWFKNKGDGNGKREAEGQEEQEVVADAQRRTGSKAGSIQDGREVAVGLHSVHAANRVIAFREVGGLHHRYERRAA